MKAQCHQCFRTIAKNHRFVQCEKCDLSYHIKCANITPAFYSRIQNKDGRSFTCQSCIDSTLPFANIEDFNENFSIVDNEVIEIPENFEEINLNKTGLNIAHININGIKSKLDFLKILLVQEKFDILCLNETKIDKSISDSEISIPGYVLYRQDRSLHGGGTMIFAADYLNTKKSSRLSKKDHEAVWIEVKIKKANPIFICSIYRPPSSRDIEHVERCCSYLSDCVDNLPNK